MAGHRLLVVFYVRDVDKTLDLPELWITSNWSKVRASVLPHGKLVYNVKY